MVYFKITNSPPTPILLLLLNRIHTKYKISRDTNKYAHKTKHAFLHLGWHNIRLFNHIILHHFHKHNLQTNI